MDRIRESRLLFALNAAAAELQKSARSQEAVFQAFAEQIGRLKLRGAISLLDESGEKLVFHVVAQPGRAIRHWEKLTGLKARGFTFPYKRVDVYRGVVETGRAVYVKDSGAVMAQLVPKLPKRVVAGILAALGSHPAIYAPLAFGERIQGVLSITGSQVRQADAPVVEAFANHFAIALNNARLVAEMQQEMIERKCVEESLLHHTQELAALYDISLDIAAYHELPTLLHDFLLHAIKLLNSSGGSIYLCDAQHRVVRTYVEYPENEAEYPGEILRYGQGAAGKVAQRGEALIIKDYSKWPGRARVFDGVKPYHAVLSLPMRWQGEVVGVLQLWETEMGRVYTEKDRDLLSLFANQAAAAVMNARLFEADRAARKRAEALEKATHIIGSSLSLKDVLALVLEQMSLVMPYDSGNIMLLEGERLVMGAWRGYREVNADTVLETISFDLSGDNSAARVFHRGEAAMIPDVSASPDWQPTAISTEIRAWLGVPLIVRDHAIGILNLDRHIPGGYSEEEITLAQAFALHAATAIENAQLFETAGRRAAELEALHQASLSLTGSLELEEVLDAILETALKLFPGANNGHIFLYNAESGNRLSFGAALWADGRRGQPMAVPRENGLTNTVARSGKAVVVTDMRLHPLYEGTPAEWQGAIVGMPLKIGERVVGVMNISYLHPRQFSADELRLLGSLGDHAAIAIENARLYEQVAAERRHLRLLYDLGRKLVATLEPDEILEQALTRTTQALGGLVGQAFIYLPEEDRLSLRVLVGKAEHSLQEYDELIRLRPGMGLAGWVALHCQPVVVGDVNLDERWLHVAGVDENVLSAISAPVMAEERLLGIFTILHHERNAFNEMHLVLLQAICNEVGLALSSASRYQEVKRRLTEITLIQNLTQAFTQRLDLQVLLDEVVTHLGRRLGYPLVEIFLIEGDKLVLRAAHGNIPYTPELSINRGIIGRVARTGQATFVPDVSRDPDYCGDIPSTVTELAVPISREEKIVGVINIETDRPDQLNWHDLDLLRVLAGQISIALENAVLYEQVRSHAEELESTVNQRSAELIELYELSQTIGMTLSYNDLIRLLISHLRNAIGSELAAGCLYKNGSHFMLVEALRPVSPLVVDLLRQKYSEASGGSEMEAEIPSLTVDINLVDEGKAGLRAIKKLGSLVQAPIIIRQRAVGLLIIGEEGERIYEESQVRLLGTFAGQAAAAIERLEAILAAEQKRLEGLVENLPTGVVLLDAEYRPLVVNKLGKEMLSLLAPGCEERSLTGLGSFSIEALIERQNEAIPLEVSAEGGPRRYFEVQAQPIDQPTRQWVITLRDVTQEHQDQARIQMQERLATVGQLAAGIAHDFNNIMAAILVYADLLKDDHALSAVSQDRLAIIQQQVQRASSLIRQILDFSRRSVMEQSSLDLMPFIKEFQKMLHRVIPETIRVELSAAPGVYRVEADPTRLQQVLMNLAVNARDAMPEGGVLKLEMHRYTHKGSRKSPVAEMPEGEYVMLSVSDTGVGISPDNIAHIYEPFFTTKPVGMGTGLGLAQVYGIIRQHNGHIDVKSQVGVGTTFSIYLPALPEGREDDAPPPEPRFEGAGETILVVEDDLNTLQALTTLLEAHNYRVLSASDGEEALRRFDGAAAQIEVVVSDVVMPKMGGVELYRTLQTRRRNLKMLFITGHPLQKENQALLETGSVHWLQKPFSVRDLSEAVRGLLDA
ncbi:MAG: GAF domain-containing protein [Anaerolineales bacterium]|nr:GAF domain-containing protein [Anaerolineales bacterium]